MGSKQDQQVLKKYDSVELIPWDPMSKEHCKRMYEQRVACTWDYHLINEWKTRVLAGQKFMYWIKLRDDFPRKDALLANHVEKCPKEREPIVDTATIFANTARTPTNVNFIPIGHIALDLYPERNTTFSLPSSTVWIKSFYISWAIQASGFGRAAMFQVERLATSPPLNATVMALDTPPKEFQFSEVTISAFHDGIDRERPKEVRANEEWYKRQGYEFIGRKEAAYQWMHPVTGVVVPVPCVYFKKDII